MAEASNNTPTIDHVIVWLDENMGVENNNKSAKDVLKTNANLTTIHRSPSIERINFLIQATDTEIPKRLITSPLRMFIDENDCLNYINDCLQVKKKVFLITSGQKGQLIVPQINRQLHDNIYIFCANRQAHENWAYQYGLNNSIYDDDKGLFAKVLCDIAAYYVEKGRDNACDGPTTTQYFKWSKQLYKSASKIDGNNRDPFIHMINDEFSTKYSNDDPMGQDADDD